MTRVLNSAPRAVSLALALTSLSCCASPIYLHSDALEKSATTLTSAFPDQTHALAPFDSQLATLSDFAVKENLAVAQYWTGVRDAHFTRLLALNLPNRTRYLNGVIDRRLIELTGSADIQNQTDPAAALAAIADLNDFAESQRRAYQSAAGANPKQDLSCPAVMKSISDKDANAYARSRSPSRVALGSLALLCRRIAERQAALPKIDATAGLIGELRKKIASEVSRASPPQSAETAALQRQVDAATKFAATGSAAAQLDRLDSELQSLLNNVGPAAKFLGWTQASDTIDAILKAEVCGSTSVAPATKEEANCSAVTPTSTAGRIGAAWGLAKAVAQLSDANAAEERSVNWLIAAKAIIAAEQADAQLSLQEAKAVSEGDGARLAALEREARYLSAAKGAALRGRPDCHVGSPGRSDPHCQLATYVDAWNFGRIPAEVLEYAPVQVDRRFNVLRARVAAQKQYALASAATQSLSGYAAGGLQSELIAQALFDATVLAGGGL